METGTGLRRSPNFTTLDLPDDHAFFRRHVHLVARLDAERFIKARLVDDGAVGAELARRVGIGFHLHDLLLVAHFHAPDLAEAHEEALVARQTVDDGSRLAVQRQFIGFICNRHAGVVADVFTQGQGAVDVVARQGAVAVVLGHQRVGLGLEAGPVFLGPPVAQIAVAVNYGAIGAVVGHEISHGLDDKGSRSDGDGNLRDWWTKEDRARFQAKADALVAQYNGYSPLPGYNVNGALTLGENIGDNSGVAIAYKAYKLSLNGQPAPVIDGLSGDQRFFMGFGQIWRMKMRDEQQIVQVKTDPHSPGQFRTNGTVVNQPGFYEAFGVKPGDKMYVAPEKRVIIW